MISRLHLTAIIAVAVLTIGVTLVVSGEQLSWKIFTSIGTAVGVTLLALTTFNKWIWKWRFLQGWFVERPHLYGDWTAELRSNWTDPATGNPPDPISARLNIEQSFAAVHMRLETTESQGDLVASLLKRGEDGRYRLYGIYQNTPRVSVRDRSTIHYGVFCLDIEGEPNAPQRLVGHYWTDRGTAGEFVAKR